MPMTSRERIETALRHREPDRTPVFEYVLQSPVADALLGRPYAGDDSHWPGMVRDRGWEAAVRQRASDILDLALRLGHDMIYATPNPMPPAGLHEDTKQEEAPLDDPVERMRLRNDAAEAADARPPEDGLLVYTLLKELMEERGADLPILAPAYAHGVWTDVDLMQTMLLEPSVAHRHFELATRRALGCAEAYIALGLDMVGVGGDFAGNSPIISPRAYREFIVPEVRKVSRRVHDAGLWAVNASDGDLWPVIDDFTTDCEVDGYLEIDTHAGMDLRRLKAACGKSITLFGGLECGNMLSFGSTEQVRQHTLDCIEAGLGDGGHILCAGNAITASVPLENYVTVVQTYRTRFALPPLEPPAPTS